MGKREGGRVTRGISFAWLIASCPHRPPRRSVWSPSDYRFPCSRHIWRFHRSSSPCCSKNDRDSCDKVPSPVAAGTWYLYKAHFRYICTKDTFASLPCFHGAGCCCCCFVLGCTVVDVVVVCVGCTSATLARGVVTACTVSWQRNSASTKHSKWVSLNIVSIDFAVRFSMWSPITARSNWKLKL